MCVSGQGGQLGDPMNMHRTCLYLEYIAFMLRREFVGLKPLPPQEKQPMKPKDWTKPEDCPYHLNFAAGHVPCDEPPGMEEAAYTRWKELGGQVEKMPEPDKRRTVLFDDELKALQRIARTLEPFPEETQQRMVRYLRDRYESTIPSMGM